VSPDTAATISVRAPGKINLALHVGSPDITGFHPLLTAFQAVDLWDAVRVSPAEAMSIEIAATFDVSSIPLDSSNLVWRAHDLLREHIGDISPAAITIDKTIPVSGGMAGGSADAAAAVIALAELFALSPDTAHLRDLARALGSDVPFTLVGGSAVGRGRGDVLEPFRINSPLSLVIVSSDATLSTPEVYRRLDELRGDDKVSLPDSLNPEFMTAWRDGDALTLAPYLHNDLQAAALSMMPTLQSVLEDTMTAGALASMVSGSGPTVIGLASGPEHASDIAGRLVEKGYRAMAVETTPLGTHLVP
jgi:4-diphosphocytidyl-2-C-methyl-D-erythritol kinase